MEYHCIKRIHLIYIFEYFFFCFLLFKLYLNPENNHLTESTQGTLINSWFIPNFIVYQSLKNGPAD